MEDTPRAGRRRSHRVGLMPFGIGEQRPGNYREILRAVRENLGQLPYAWRILTRGACDGCALGSAGLKDWTLPGVHLCNVRLRLLRLNTLPPLDERLLADVGPLTRKDGRELRRLGRLPRPLLRRRGEPGFRPVGWDEALDLIAARIRDASSRSRGPDGAGSPDRTAFYLTSRGMANEAYYAAAEGGTRDRHRLGGQRGPHLPLAEHGGPQGDPGRRRHHLLLHRPRSAPTWSSSSAPTPRTTSR